jgi:hypothetical protein
MLPWWIMARHCGQFSCTQALLQLGLWASAGGSSIVSATTWIGEGGRAAAIVVVVLAVLAPAVDFVTISDIVLNDL